MEQSPLTRKQKIKYKAVTHTASGLTFHPNNHVSWAIGLPSRARRSVVHSCNIVGHRATLWQGLV
jgi:hypothetical protein